MDDPVTDVVIVTDPLNCPQGYTVLKECPCGHEAQLWEKVHGGEDNTRYLCFTKKRLSSNTDEDKVVESLYIPGGGVQYLMPYYEVIPKTFEGDREPLRHKQLAVKKVKRSIAKEVVADIVIAKGKDSISRKFKKLEKINGVRICYRQERYTPASTPVRPTHTVDDMSLETQNLSLENPRTRAQTEHSPRHTSPPVKNEIRRSSIPEPTYPPQPLSSAPTSRNPPTQPLVEEVVTVQLVQSVASVPPPSVNSHPSTGPQDELDSPVTTHPSYSIPQPSESVGPTPQLYYPHTAPGPSGGYHGSQYPPSTGYQQPASYHPPPHGYPQQGVYSAQPYVQPGVYPHAAPSPTASYDTSIGFSLGGGVNTYPQPQPGHHQPQSPMQSPMQYVPPPGLGGQYPPSFPSPPAPPSQPTFPPSGSSNSIGFNY